MKAEEKDWRLPFDVEQQVPSRIIGDSAPPRQVLINLVNNAVNLTEMGEVVVAVGWEAERKHRHSLSFSVRDTGIGLDDVQMAGYSSHFRRRTRRLPANTEAQVSASPSAKALRSR